MRILVNCSLLFCITVTSAAAASRATYYRDGAVYQQEAVAVKGVIEVTLPPTYLEHTLTVTPATGSTLVSVSSHDPSPIVGSSSERETLVEQRKRLEDRLQALETREAIFTSAAKAQSGKTPRKTKTNPDPLQTIRQGTDFAIAQLEAVYTARRKTNQEIRKIDAKLAGSRTSEPTNSYRFRISVSPAKGSVTLRYATSERGWQPQYQLHLNNDGTARLELAALHAMVNRGTQGRVSPAAMEEMRSAESFPISSGRTTMTRHLLPFTVERSIEGVYFRFSGILTNTTPTYLPPGDGTLFRNGAYLGSFRFDGLSSGRSRTIRHGI